MKTPYEEYVETYKNLLVLLKCGQSAEDHDKLLTEAEQLLLNERLICDHEYKRWSTTSRMMCTKCKETISKELYADNYTKTSDRRRKFKAT